MLHDFCCCLYSYPSLVVIHIIHLLNVIREFANDNNVALLLSYIKFALNIVFSRILQSAFVFGNTLVHIFIGYTDTSILAHYKE